MAAASCVLDAIALAFVPQVAERRTWWSTAEQDEDREGELNG